MITQKHELYGVEKHMSAIIVENLTFSYSLNNWATSALIIVLLQSKKYCYNFV